MLYFTSSQVLVAIWVCENQNGFMWIHDVPHLSTVFFSELAFSCWQMSRLDVKEYDSH
jgi:hypothetical protein